MSTMMKKRKNISEENKELFLSIMKTSDGGRFWKTIVVGDGDVTNQDRHDSWVAVAKQFSEVMAMEFTPKQYKDLWFRIKASKKIKHDLKKIAPKLVVGLPPIFLLLWMVTTTVSENQSLEETLV